MKTFYCLEEAYYHGSHTVKGTVTDIQAEKKPRNYEYHKPRGPIGDGTITYSKAYYETREEAEAVLADQIKLSDFCRKREKIIDISTLFLERTVSQ